MKYARIIWILLVSLTLTNCANRSHTGAVLGAGTGTTVCLEYISDNPYLIATCAVGAALQVQKFYIRVIKMSIMQYL